MLADYKKYPAETVEKDGSMSTVPYFVDTGSALVTRDNVERFLQVQARIQPEEAAVTE
jgi:hypothetical protein